MIPSPSLRAAVAAAARSTDGDPIRAGRSTASELSSQLGRDRVQLVIAFACGPHASATQEVAAGIRDTLPGCAIACVSAAGTLDPEGEVESGPAVAALGLVGPPVRAVVRGRRVGAASRSAPGEIETAAAELGTELRRELGAVGSAMLLVAPESFRPGILGSFTSASEAGAVIGGGTASGPKPITVAGPGESPEVVDLAVIGFGAGVRMASAASPAARLVTPMLPVTRVARNVVLEIGGRPALEVLSDAVRGRADRPTILVALGPREDAKARGGHLLLRGIAGVDPASKGIFLAEPLVEGQPIALAIREGAAAREDLDRSLRDLSRRCAGGAAIAALCVDCAGRGHSLYGAAHVDSRAIRTRLPGLPMAGFFSSFEIAMFEGQPRLHLYTAVVAVLYAPS
ncbi:MAG: FIST C-terminal domain-containing protein [Deltaproteobacteria bacterium]|nr:FIST C-terminal domain-containing protein [Deltaproteobacteria bacterium]